MPRFIPPKAYGIAEIKGNRRPILPKDAFAAFNLNILGLGNVAAPAVPTDAIAAVFDLQGFTNFCKQIEPHLSVPKYLSAFLNWIMETLREEMRDGNHETNAILWCPLPFFVKYMGDGLLVLWDCGDIDDVSRTNVIVSCSEVCKKYRSDFIPTLKTSIVEPPPALRCGVARGTVFSVGEGQDYVGSCINMAARLQKLPGISFCFNRRGFELDTPNNSSFFPQQVVIKEVSIRGIGDHELVGVLSQEVEKLPPRDTKLFREPK
jgi:hypothetical protein